MAVSNRIIHLHRGCDEGTRHYWLFVHFVILNNSNRLPLHAPFGLHPIPLSFVLLVHYYYVHGMTYITITHAHPRVDSIAYGSNYTQRGFFFLTTLFLSKKRTLKTKNPGIPPGHPLLWTLGMCTYKIRMYLQNKNVP